MYKKGSPQITQWRLLEQNLFYNENFLFVSHCKILLADRSVFSLLKTNLHWTTFVINYIGGPKWMKGCCKFWFTCSLAPVANSLPYGWTVSTTGEFTHNIRGLSSNLTCSRYYGLWPLLTALNDCMSMLVLSHFYLDLMWRY